VKKFVEDNPHTAVLIGIGIGFFIGYAAHQPPRRHYWINSGTRLRARWVKPNAKRPMWRTRRPLLPARPPDRSRLRRERLSKINPTPRVRAQDHLTVAKREPLWCRAAPARTQTGSSINRSSAARLSFRCHPFRQCFRATSRGSLGHSLLCSKGGNPLMGNWGNRGNRRYYRRAAQQEPLYRGQAEPATRALGPPSGSRWNDGCWA
jgi:hypothetical protein